MPQEAEETEETRDEIDLLIAGNAHIDMSTSDVPEGESIADAVMEAKLLFGSLTEIVDLLSEVIGEIPQDHMLAAELSVSLDETRQLLARCSNRPAHVPARPRAATPWGGTRRTAEPDAA